MTALAGASAGVKDMADGSLRITIEFEPKDAKAAFELFGSRGTPIAVAALKVGFAAVKDEPPAEKVKVGPLCREAVGYCEMPEFHQWARASGKASARIEILERCGVLSRKELDTQPTAGQRFIEQIRIPFMHYMKTREVKFKEPV